MILKFCFGFTSFNVFLLLNVFCMSLTLKFTKEANVVAIAREKRGQDRLDTRAVRCLLVAWGDPSFSREISRPWRLILTRDQFNSFFYVFFISLRKQFFKDLMVK